LSPGLRRLVDDAAAMVGNALPVPCAFRKCHRSPFKLPAARIDGGVRPPRAMHLDDEISNLWLNARSSRRPRSAVPAPVQAEALSVPADHGLRAHEEESFTPSRPKLRKPGPEHPVGGLKRGRASGALALEDEPLVAKRENLGLELGARPQQRSNRSQESRKGRARHRRHVDPARRKHQSFHCGREFGRHK